MRQSPCCSRLGSCYDWGVRHQFVSGNGVPLPSLPRLACGIIAALAFIPALQADWPGAERIDAAINEAVADGLTPGAVAWIESRGQQLHFASYGARSLEPEREVMSQDTIFDCASLTKVMATAPAVMILVEAGLVRLNDEVREYLPDFRDNSGITVLQLLTHYSGLRPSLDLDPAWSGYGTGVARALLEQPIGAPGSKFIYSDINYILLAEIVRRTSGMSIDEFAKTRIFQPLGMHETMYLPPPELRKRIAPTEKLPDGTILRGVVHDPTTRMMGGISGHAGVFSTAENVARFARMMLNGGELDGVRILSPLSVLRMRTPQSPEGASARGIGWDIDSRYATPRGDLFGTESYGHTGYTGPSLWIDPVSDSFVALMTNRVHPVVATSVVRLRSIVASISAAGISRLYSNSESARRAERSHLRRAPYAEVQTGLDVLLGAGFQELHGKEVALITNQTGIDRLGRRNIDLFAQAEHVTLKRIFTPEHGLDGVLDQPEIIDGTDPRTGIKTYSLFQTDRRRPPSALLDGLDALIFDIQDVGARFYTYITTMGFAMEAAAEAGVPFYVLDRPNPINGVDVEGPVLDTELESFVGYHRLPVRHGMTVGELARMFNGEREIGAELTVVKMEGWRRDLWFDETGLPWVNPSPNIRNLDQATLYPGIAMLEWLEDYSVGRGTDTPFQFIGAAWTEGSALADAIRRESIPGVRVYARKLRPRDSVLQGSVVDGVQFTITDRDALQPTRLGLAIAAALRRLYGSKADLGRSERLIGSRAVIKELNEGRDAMAATASSVESLIEFRTRRQQFLLY